MRFAGSNSSALFWFVPQSTVSIVSSGSVTQLSSSLTSALPVPVGVHVMFFSSNSASSGVSAFDSMNVPSASTTPLASPIVCQSAGGGTGVHSFWIGSKSAPSVVNTWLLEMYSPPSAITLPSGSTAVAKYVGA